MEINKAIELATEYFKDKTIPKNTREWRTNCPPELTTGKINSLQFTVGDVLRAINPSIRSRAKNVIYNLESLGISELLLKGTKAQFTCGGCNTRREVSRDTIRLWNSKGTKYCSICREVSGVIKTSEYYQTKVPKDYVVLEVLSEASNTKCKVKHLPCGTIREYSSRHLLARDTEGLACGECDGTGRFDSLHEKEVVTYLISKFPSIVMEFGVPYKALIDTGRRWTLDVYIKELNLCLEITTKGNGFTGYFDNLTLKLDSLIGAGFVAKVVYSKLEAEDIVRSLLKDKEC